MASRGHNRYKATPGPTPLYVNDEESDITAGIFGLAVVCIPLFICWCCCCRRRRGVANDSAVVEQVRVDGELVDVAFLRQKKTACTGYILWLGAGLFGAHHFYLDRLVHGVLAAFTLNFYLVGWLIDAFLVPRYVRSFNEHTSPLASTASVSCRRMCLLMVVFVAAVAFDSYILIKGPELIESTGIVDIESELAGSDGNPFDLLSIPRDTPLEDVDAEWNKVKRREAGVEDPSCNAACKKALREKRVKAMRYLKKKREAMKTLAARRAAEEGASSRNKKVEGRWSDTELDGVTQRWEAIGQGLYRRAGSPTMAWFTQDGEAEEERARDSSEL